MNQNKNNQEAKFCKKIVYRINKDVAPTVLLGLMEDQDENFFYFRTAKRQHTIAKSTVLSVEDTEVIFQEVQQ